MGGWRELDFSPIGYQHSVWEAGGQPVILPVIDAEAAPEILEHLDGLVLQGGEDVSPELYGGYNQADHEHYLLRDQVEMELVRAAMRQRKPMLAICRGVQLFNVMTGGTLDQDIAKTTDHPRGGSVEIQEAHRHQVTITKGTRLYDIIGSSAVVNSFHHQAIAEVGELVVSAAAPDGVIEAAELPEEAAKGWWNLGVQWHPERLAAFSDDTAAKALFAALVKACR